MPTIKTNNRTSRYSILAGAWDIYAKETGTDEVFEGLGYLIADSCKITVSPQVIEIDNSAKHAHKYSFTLTAVLAQSDRYMIDTLSDLSSKNRLDIYMRTDALDSRNFVLRKASILVEGDIALAAKQARTIPITIHGYFSNISELFEAAVVATDIDAGDFVANDFKITHSSTGFTSGMLTNLGLSIPEAFDTSKGVSDGMLAYSPWTLDYSAYSKDFVYEAKFKITSLTGREIGLAIITADGYNVAEIGYATYFMVHGGKVLIYVLDRAAHTLSARKTINLPMSDLNEEFTLRLKIKDDVVWMYQEYNGEIALLDKYTLEYTHDDGYAIGVVVRANNGTGSEANYMYNLKLTTDII